LCFSGPVVKAEKPIWGGSVAVSGTIGPAIPARGAFMARKLRANPKVWGAIVFLGLVPCVPRFGEAARTNYEFIGRWVRRGKGVSL